jgi:hypothetical protein
LGREWGYEKELRELQQSWQELKLGLGELATTFNDILGSHSSDDLLSPGPSAARCSLR